VKTDADMICSVQPEPLLSDMIKSPKEWRALQGCYTEDTERIKRD
jgi:hypothetical protein